MLKFKVLSGPQFGAIINLVLEKDVTISNQIGSDIYLQSLSESKQECTVIVNQENVLQFRQLGSVIELADGAAVNIDQDYTLPCFFRFDGIEVAIGQESEIQSWPNELFDVENQLLKDIEDYSTNSIKSGHKLKQKMRDVYHFILNHSVSSMSFIYARLKNLYQKNPVYFFIVSTLIVASCIGGGYLIHEIIIANRIELVENGYNLMSQGLKSKFAALPSKYLALSLQSSGKKFDLVGVVQDSADIQFLQTYFRPYLSIISFHLVTLNEAIAKIKLGMADVKVANLKIFYDINSQNIIISGLALNGMTAINDAQVIISDYLPFISNLDFSKIYDVTQLRKDLNELLKNISNTLTATENLESGVFEIHGYLTQGQLDQLNMTLSNLQVKYGKTIKFDLDIQDSMKALPFKIYSVYLGTPAYIVTDNNQFVFVGGEIHGFKLLRITNEKIILSGKYTLEIPFAQMTDNLSESAESKLNASASREQILRAEFNKVKDSLTKEQQLLAKIKQYKDPIGDKDISDFLGEEQMLLEEDIKNKQNDLKYLNSGAMQ